MTNTLLKRLLQLYLLLFSAEVLQAQQLPDQMRISADGRMLLMGDQANTGLYDLSLVRRIDLTFPQANFWTLLTNNYASKTYLPATLTVGTSIFDSVGVRFRGNTSYQTGTSQKKSFKIELDNWKAGADYNGYSTIKLNNAAQDASMMREVVYTSMIKRHCPTARTSFVKLYLNGANWGLYSNVQQLNKDFLEEWYFSNDGSWWRADSPTGGGGGGWGDGTAGLNYISADTTTYKTYYTLKSYTKTNPWTDLVTICNKLNNTASAGLIDTLSNYLDIDRTLWYLASEIAWTDDDSYVYKGKMDYYVHYDLETSRFTPHEYDGNSAIATSAASSWSPFYNVTNVNYPLLNKLLNVPELRQRYLAHLRTIIADEFDTAKTNLLINAYKALVDTVVNNDPKKMFTYAQWTSEVNVIKNFVTTRKNYLNSNAEVAQTAPVIASAPYYTSGVMYQRPYENQSVTVKANVTSTNGIDNVQLYYSNAITGKFTKTQMYDDGAHGDGAAGDGAYGASIPGFAAGTWVRYYVQATSATTAKSMSYLPAGAEHDVFIYTVAPFASADTSIVINEFMASNTATVADEAGEYDDWVELYNKSNLPVDLTGYAITDNPVNLSKWNFPAGTIMQPNSYLIIWADEDSSQGAFHANFKLSASGESMMLLDASLHIIDSVSWGTQTTDMGYARVPNGTGNFYIQAPTFNANNSHFSADIKALGVTSFCYGDSVILQANSGIGYTYQWQKNGTNISGATSQNYTATATGSYSVIVTNGSGISATSGAIAVVRNANPTATITVGGSLTFCSGSTVLLTANNGSGYTYQWQRNAVDIPAAVASSYTVNQSGNFRVIVTNPAGCTKAATAVKATKVTVTATVTAGGSTTFCNGDSVQLTANNGSGYSYQWLRNNTNISGATSALYTVKQQGWYRVNITHSSGCSKLSSSIQTIVNCRIDGSTLSDLSVFPNPMKDYAIFDISNGEEATIRLEVYNSLGQIVSRETTNSSTQITFHRNGLPAGLYYYSIRLDDDLFRTGKLVIE